MTYFNVQANLFSFSSYLFINFHSLFGRFNFRIITLSSSWQQCYCDSRPTPSNHVHYLNWHMNISLKPRRYFGVSNKFSRYIMERIIRRSTRKRRSSDSGIYKITDFSAIGDDVKIMQPTRVVVCNRCINWNLNIFKAKIV